MTFCPLCGAHHDSNVGCADRTGEILRDAGIPRPEGKRPPEELRQVVKKADRFLLIVLAIVGAIIIGVVVKSAIFR